MAFYIHRTSDRKLLLRAICYKPDCMPMWLLRQKPRKLNDYRTADSVIICARASCHGIYMSACINAWSIRVCARNLSNDILRNAFICTAGNIESRPCCPCLEESPSIIERDINSSYRAVFFDICRQEAVCYRKFACISRVNHHHKSGLCFKKAAKRLFVRYETEMDNSLACYVGNICPLIVCVSIKENNLCFNIFAFCCR